ncbi:heme ABC exporter, ATP-binding protein CcmA [Anaerobacillus alkalidiazotrophicus]|uniref:Heme ABC exporter, ATP-binding protein CcmA n=1 Tax=Anaerobacillus alkalidiazotrophicus TaxID=472963 RepID=A0A1S2M6J1_9BACI|nr:heme ABC exporter ATP-binding protein CcmA [Anaerobacillus alkalidiazotrophicus]OIJ20402.1 heme ABC exporter, ATP-binding protein CcmA [Anaerobacillus alkalidiazotrophicus]
MIETKGLIKTIGDKMILRGINLSIEKGETVAILGPNGAGKSTVLKILGGLVKASSGEVKIAGLDLKKGSYDSKRKIGFLAHNSFLYDHLSPLENLKFFGKLYGVQDVENRAKQLIDEVGLSFFMHDPVRSFSRGMIQRIAIARAIIHDPEILLFDEPHTGLDQQAIQLLNKVILRMKQEGATIIMVTHDFGQALETCDRFVIIKNGKVVDDLQNIEKNLDAITEKYMEQVASL